MCDCVHAHVSPCGGQRRALCPLELEVAVSSRCGGCDLYLGSLEEC